MGRYYPVMNSPYRAIGALAPVNYPPMVHPYKALYGVGGCAPCALAALMGVGAVDLPTYTIKGGDSLSAIANRFGTTVTTLVNMNLAALVAAQNVACGKPDAPKSCPPLPITNAMLNRDLIFPGTVLVVPPSAKVPEDPNVPPPPPPPVYVEAPPSATAGTMGVDAATVAVAAGAALLVLYAIGRMSKSKGSPSQAQVQT